MRSGISSKPIGNAMTELAHRVQERVLRGLLGRAVCVLLLGLALFGLRVLLLPG